MAITGFESFEFELEVYENVPAERLLLETKRGGLDLLTQLFFATPVDEGYARGNWQVSIGSPIESEIARKDRTGASAIAAGRQVIEQLTPFDILWVVNNTPYIVRLNEGWSAQARAMFFENVLTRVASALERRLAA